MKKRPSRKARKPSPSRKRKLSQDELFVNTILDNIPDMIFVKDAKELRFIRFNKAGEQMLGMTTGQLLGKSDYDFFPKQEADFFTRKDREVLRGRKMVDIPEEPIHSPKKGLRILHTKKIPVMDARGRPRYLLGISEDITDRKNIAEALRRANETLEKRVQERTVDLQQAIADLQNEIAERKRIDSELKNLNTSLEKKVEDRTRELTQAVKELEAFSYSVSHDLRAPLRAIEGFAQILQEEQSAGLTTEAQRLLKIVQKNAVHMSQLIDDLLQFSRISRKNLIKDPVDMTHIAQTAVDSMVQANPDRAVEIVLDTLPSAKGDGAMLRQVFMNLLSNAFKFTRPKEKARIEIRGDLRDKEIIYRVRDNGVGFDMQFAEKLFGVFQRLHAASEFEGTGVGLAIVQRIVHKHGGRVWAESEPGAGTTIYFALPR